MVMKHFLSCGFFSSDLWKAAMLCLVFRSDCHFSFFSSNQNIVENFTSCQHGRKSCTCLVCESSVRWLHEQSQLAEDLLQIKPPPKKSTHMPSSTVFFQHFFLGGWDGANFGLGFFLAEKGVSKIRFAKKSSKSVDHPEVRFVGSRSLCYTRTWKGHGEVFFWEKVSWIFVFLGFFRVEFWLMGWWYGRCIFFVGILVDGMILFWGLKMKICLDSR